MPNAIRHAAAVAVAVLVFAQAVASASASAQTSGSVIGLVVASDDTPIASARIRLEGRGAAQIAVTDEAGSFALAQVEAGTYSISVQAKGFSQIDGRSIEVAPGAATQIRLVMSTLQVSSLTVLGQVSIHGGEALSHASAPSVDISAQSYASKGVTRVTDMAGAMLGTAVVPTVGAGFNAPDALALRSGEPGETLVEVDGHQVNSGGTGDFDVSLLDPADLQSVELVYGIAPSSLVGPDTEGGAINIRTLEPTAASQGLVRFTGSSYNTFGETLQATGTDERVGYALSYHRLSSGGEVHDLLPDSDGSSLATGDGLVGSSALAKFRYAFGSAGGFVGVTFRDQAAFRDLTAALASDLGDGTFDGSPGTAALAHTAAYGLDLQVPIGRTDPSGLTTTTALFRHLTSLTSQSVVGAGVATSPYLYNDRDLIGDDTLELTRAFSSSSLSLRFADRTESLVTDLAPGVANNDSGVRHPSSSGLGEAFDAGTADDPAADTSHPTFDQVQRSIGLRYSLDRTWALHYTFAAYFSDYSAAGHSIDPRFGFVWTPKAESALRFSVGSTFQSPQLPSLFAPAHLPPPVGGYISVGNPGLRAERAIEYDLGYEHLFGNDEHRLHVGVDLYRTNIRDGITTFLPSQTCPPADPSGPHPACLSFPINAGRQVYSGFESHADLKMGYRTAMHAAFGEDSVYVLSVPASAQDGSIVPFEQALGVPLHKGSLSFEFDPNRIASYTIGANYEGWYNEMNRPPFATLNAQAAWHLKKVDLIISGTNLTGVYDDKITQVGVGTPYGGIAGPIATNALVLPGRVFTMALTRRF